MTAAKQPQPEQVVTVTVWPNAVIGTVVPLPPSHPLPTPHVAAPKGSSDG